MEKVVINSYEEFEKLVGQRIGVSEYVEIPQERINLFADALLKTIGLRYEARKSEYLSSFGKGIRVLKAFWQAKGLDVEGLHLYDGSGLALMLKRREPVYSACADCICDNSSDLASLADEVLKKFENRVI